MKTYNISRLPTMITLGYDGENNWRPHSFDCSPLLANHPNGTISLWLLPNGETQAFPVALTRNGNSVVWTPLSEEMTAATGALQLVCTDGTDVGKSTVVLFRVDESIVPGADHPATVPSWATETIERAENAADRAEEAAESIDIEQIEQTIANAVEEYLREHPVAVPVQSVNGKTGAVTLSASDVGAMPSNYMPPVTSVNGKTGAVSLNAEDVGALPSDTPIPPAMTVDSALSSTSENPVQNKVINAALQSKGTYSKPSGGIPASDLAPGVIPVVPQMAMQTDMSDWASGKTVDAAVLRNDFTVALAAMDNLELNKADKTEIPTKTSDLTNDSGFITASQVPSDDAFEKIADITFDGNTVFSIDKDTNGQAFRLKKAVLMVSNGAASANGTAMFQFRYANVFVYRAYISYSANQAGRIMFVKVWQENQRWYGQHIPFANNGFDSLRTQTEDITSWLAKTVSTYPYIDNVNTAWTPPEGTRAVLLGIRA